MELITQYTNHISQEQVISYDVTSNTGIRLRAHIGLVTDKFLEYQKDILTEFIADLSNEANKSDSSFRKFKNYVEFALQELNSKLAVFAEKVTDTPSFDIRGIVEVFYENEYLASLIGDISFIILRHNKVYYSLFNETSKKVKISLFSDFVEGDLSDGDQIIIIGNDVSQIVDEHDLSDLSDVVGSTDETFLDLLTQMIEQRSGQGTSAFDVHTLIRSQQRINISSASAGKIKSKVSNWIAIHQYQIGMIVFGCVILALIYSIVSNYRTQHGNIIVTDGSGTQVDITLESIKKDIALFQRLEATSPTKITTYNDIKNKITLLEQTKQSPLDIQELKKILEEEYYKGFRIHTINQFDSSVLDFTDSDKNTIGNILGIYIGQNGFHVGGTKASLVGGVNNQIKGTLIRYNQEVLTSALQGCASSLGRAGLYCYDNNGQIYLITKSGIESVINADNHTSFPGPIASIGTFSSNNMYILTNNAELKQSNTHIIRYQTQGNNPMNFRGGQNYNFTSAGEAGDTYDSMAIDGTFIMWKGNTRQLVQFRRDGVTPNERIVPIRGGDNIEGAYSATGVSVISYDTSKYVYLWDAPQGQLTVFESSPNKTAANSKTTFTLNYVMRLRFDSSLGVKGVIISDSLKPDLWAVTDKGVFLYSISQDIEQYATQNVN